MSDYQHEDAGYAATTEPGKPRRKAWKIGLIVALCAVVGAGGIGAVAVVPWAQAKVDAVPDGGTGSSAAVAAKPVELGVSPVDGAVQVNPVAPAAVKAVNGKLKAVSLVDNKTGAAAAGSLSADGTSWTAAGPLAFDTSYTYTLTVLDGANRESTKTQTFSTVPAANEADATSYVRDGGTVGAGQPVELTFSEPVLNKAAVENAIKITSSSGQVGAFRWFGDKIVRYRPENFWTAKSVVTVDLKLLGVDFGNGMIGNFNKTITMNVGDKKVLVADAANHVSNLYVNDVLVRTMPVTMGDTRFPSAAGFLVMMEKEKEAVFKAGSIGLQPGDPAYYGTLNVSNAIRITTGGEYVHQALPAAYGNVGNSNVSHGCVGLLPDDANWVFDNMTTGDLVQVINSERGPTEADDGFGDWNIPWAQYASRG